MRTINKHFGIYSMKQIKTIQQTTSYEYISEIKRTETKDKSNNTLYKVVLSDTYTGIK